MASKKMNKALQAALQELRSEKSRIEAAINELESVITSLGGARRGRPIGSGKPAGVKKKVRKNWSPAARKAAAQRMKKYWAERRKKQGA